jgi:6-phosphofructokinase
MVRYFCLAEQMELLLAYGESRDHSAAYRAIAVATGENANSIRKIRHGENANPGLRTLMALADEFQVDLAISTPRSLDNDLAGTAVTFDFDTAVGTATEALDRLHTTAESHHRVRVLKLMGRDSGFIALHAGVAGNADAILIPEIPFDIEVVWAKVREREAGRRRHSIVAVSEGARPADGSQGFRTLGDAIYCPRLGGIGQQVGAAIEQVTGEETRVTVLGHLQRGGSPSTYDRWLATRFGAAAARRACQGGWGGRVGLRGQEIVDATLAEAIVMAKWVDPEGETVRTARGPGLYLWMINAKGRPFQDGLLLRRGNPFLTWGEVPRRMVDRSYSCRTPPPPF